ncbi:hypothetical protein [Streptomyces prunicolor]|uniref:hypothetical protein n=1 Tax=Streptomyces prunicolor TaxID=67348 RepID=UPI0033E1E979
MSEIFTGDLVTHWTHPGEVGEVVETEPVRTGGKVHHVVWPGSDIAIPYFSHGTLKKAAVSE